LKIFYGRLVYFVVIWFFPRFGILHQEKSGNPARSLAYAVLQFLQNSFTPNIKTSKEFFFEFQKSSLGIKIRLH
jgi:hypothetical protein